MKVISKTETGFLCDVSHNEMCNILDKFSRYELPDERELLGKTIKLADLWKSVKDRIALESSLKALKIEAQRIMEVCDGAQPYAEAAKKVLR